MKPEELLFAETHEWVHIHEQDGSKIATMGISAYALEQLTDVTHLELPEVGRSVVAGEEFGEVESTKAVSSIYSPVEGEVIEVNETLSDQFEALNQLPYDEGWIAKIRITNDASLADLKDYATYQKQCAAGG